jgi:N-acyl-D-aspartate/D-glutamate deacylase
MHDLVLRGGTIVDGTGGAPFAGDIAINGDTISVVGEGVGAGRQELDVDGLLVTPGFVDVHTHYDAQALWDPLVGSSCWHGVTTVVMGNCGVGFAPVRRQQRDWLINLMQGVEDIPADVLRAGLDWRWETFGQYLDALGATSRAIDIAAQVPHAPVRVYAMGERGLDGAERPNADELATIAQVTRDALVDGAVGVSTLRTRMHRSSDGRLIPTYCATDEELLALATGMRDAGRGVLEVASDYSAGSVAEEFARYRMMAEHSGRPVTVPFSQTHDDPDGWREVLGHIETAARDGLPFSAQIAVRPVGLIMSLESRNHLFSSCPTYQDMAGLALSERVSRLRDADIRRRILEEATAVPARIDLARTFAMESPVDYEPDVSRSIASRAHAGGQRPLELAYDALLADEGTAVLYAPQRNYAGGVCDSVRDMLASPCAVPGLGDGGAHCTQICDMSFPTTLLTLWGRDRRRGDLFDIAWLVRKQTAVTAALYGFADRGRIAPGMRADLNGIDFTHLGVHPPRMAYDFPAGGKRLIQRADGYRYTIVAGALTFVDGEHTGALAGRVVRRGGNR